MKNVLFIMLTLLCFPLFSQTIPTDTIIMKGGATYAHWIVKENKKFIFIDRNGKQAKIPKSSIKEIKRSIENLLNLDDETKTIKVSHVIPVNGYSKEQIYSVGREWMVDAFVSADDVIQMDDKEAGKVVGKGYANYHTSLNIWVGGGNELWFTVRIYSKDGKVKFIMDNMRTLSIDSKGKRFSKIPLKNTFWKINNGERRKGFKNERKEIERICRETLIDFLMSFEKSELEEHDNW